ncbi:hypothetical protein [Longimicrobium sp.]|uniref:hypothetical protein n=1 Tax=Longimicrobium sp. TaxID=2029185 RepID=UPI002E332462|nr:hypothetical protein [Longimicrobium sp.]HEX6042479.1 hypothetical protein [Longimicrobium sp.]
MSAGTSAGVPALQLRRALLRHEHGRVSAHRLGEMLRTEHRRLAAAFDGVEDGVVRRHAPGLLREYEAVSVRADDALGTNRLRDALRELLRARELLASMRDLVRAAHDIEAGADRLEELARLAGVARLRALPCLDAPARVLAAARERVRDGRFVHAGHLARACGRQTDALVVQESAARRADAPDLSLESLRALCEATRPLAHPAPDDPAADGSLEVLHALAADGFICLAERMAQELGALLAPRARLYEELARFAEWERAGVLARLRDGLSQVPADQRWDAAARILWRERLQEDARRLREQGERRAGAPFDTPSAGARRPDEAPIRPGL